ncbi:MULTISPECIES: hypothetical protein [unclassified Paenibacillus]|uniref:hypothetical protein n=1 Tax=unclassified Paenibacillus TaxID=185978 RepID=UPI002F41138A
MRNELMKRKDYNPYEDSSLHSTHPNEMQHTNGREGFNDIIKHVDRVNGFQSPKSMDEVPRSCLGNYILNINNTQRRIRHDNK